MDERHDTLFDDDNIEEQELAHVDFDLLDTNGRWFLKVLSGPNTGAEFSMQSGTSYLIGTDTATCDIVFQDLSVSRQHARIAIDSQDRVAIEDLNSRNGTFINGEKLVGRKAAPSNTLISMGTTTFILIDREGERQTIISPMMPHTEKKENGLQTETSKEAATTPTNLQQSSSELQKESLPPIQQAVLPPLHSEVEKIKEEERKQARINHTFSALVILAAITGLFVIIGVGTTLLFRTQPVEQRQEKNADAEIARVLKDYPSVRFSFNPATGKLLLVGHVQSAVDRSKILDTLDDLKFITSVDSNNIIIDEGVWREINQVISKNPNWKSITITSPAPGRFVLSGFLSTKKQAEELYDYVTQNFAYPDLLEKKVVVEEDLKDEVMQKLTESGFRTVAVKLSNGQLTFTGNIANGTMPKYSQLLEEIKKIPGVRNLQSFVTEVPQKETMVNLSDRYEVTGYSVLGNRINVVINGRILHKGDSLDGMVIIDIQPNAVLLEKNDVKYRIDFNR